MAHRLTLTARVRWRLSPWWGRVLAVYLATRIITGAIMAWMAVVEARATGAAVSDPFTLGANWDGQWYWLIAVSGYPHELPIDASGHVMNNAWAFMPVYPFVVGALARLGFPFPIAGLVLSLVAGAAAVLFFERLLRGVGMSRDTALFGVALLCVAPLSPMFQVSYAEALGLALLFLALLLVQRRRFLWLLPVLPVLALTRPLALAFALFLLLYFGYRIWGHVRHPDAGRLGVRECASIIAAGLVSFSSGIAWPLIAWATTGQPNAYIETELAWRAGYLGYGELVPFEGWFAGLAYWFRFIGAPDAAAWGMGVLLMAALLVFFAVLLTSPWGGRLGVELRLWSVSYVVYLLAVFFPQSSTWRLLLPLAPLLGAFALTRSRVGRVLLVAAGIVGQVLWVYGCWIRMPGDWSPP